MLYFNTQTDDFGVTFLAAITALPHMSIPLGTRDFAHFAGYDETPAPAHNPLTHAAHEAPPQPVDGVLTQQWEIVPLTEQEAEAERLARVPQQITRAQGKAALIHAGLWAGVLAHVDVLPEPDRALADIALHDTLNWRRDSPFLKACAAGLGLTERQLDDLFTQAAQIEL